MFRHLGDVNIPQKPIFKQNIPRDRMHRKLTEAEKFEVWVVNTLEGQDRIIRALMQSIAALARARWVSPKKLAQLTTEVDEQQKYLDELSKISEENILKLRREAIQKETNNENSDDSAGQTQAGGEQSEKPSEKTN